MQTQASIVINSSKEKVWQAIKDIENYQSMISAIMKINILNKPEEGLVGLKWEETREMFGKEAMETMWVTEAVENENYCTRAENHGAVYLTRLSLKSQGDVTELTTTFTGEAENIVTKILSVLMDIFIKGSLKKALLKDLEDIKAHVEKSTDQTNVTAVH